MEPLKIVARYTDGRIVTGTTLDFSPDRSFFHLSPIRGKCKPPEQVHLADLKALFFVKSFEGRPEYHEQQQFTDQSPPGRKLRVTFKDGEMLQGTTCEYSPRAPGFFLFPADPRSNNHKIFIVNDAVRQTRYL